MVELIMQVRPSNYKYIELEETEGCRKEQILEKNPDLTVPEYSMSKKNIKEENLDKKAEAYRKMFEMAGII